jgi:hypothetical protein
VIRPIRAEDIATLQQLQNGFDWEFGPDYLQGLVATDDADVPVMFMAAWIRAEVHMVVDSKWATPGTRLCFLQQMHDAMEVELKVRNVGQAVTWFDAAVTKLERRFLQRMAGMGWVRSERISWHREVR